MPTCGREVYMRTTYWRLLAVGTLAAAAAGVTLGAQGSRAADPQVLNVLVSEVRGLRQAIEQMATVGAHVQLALGRLQLQEQRVNAIIRRGEALRDAIARAQKDVAASQAHLAMVGGPFKEKPGDAAAAAEDNPVLAPMLKSLKDAVAAGQAEVQRLQNEEAFLQQQIANEQGRWSEINRALEELERVLSKRGAP